MFSELRSDSINKLATWSTVAFHELNEIDGIYVYLHCSSTLYVLIGMWRSWPKVAVVLECLPS